MKEKMRPSILSGFMELPPREQLLFNDMVQRMIKVYEQNGCLPMDTPLIEKEEILLAKSGGETEKQIYRIANDKTKQALRFDLTVPFARYVVQHMNEITFPFKRYQIGKVYRGERNQKGRYREFYQLDIDIINPKKLEVTNDAFVLKMASEAFESIGLQNYVFQISNRKILSSLLALMGIGNAQQVMVSIDKYDKIGKENCLNEIEGLIGSLNTSYMIDLLQIKGDSSKVIDELSQFAERIKKQFVIEEMGQENNDYLKLREGICELEVVINTLKLLGLQEKNFKIAFKIIRGLDYYTGTIFETVIEGNESYGSICSGGRYDNLTACYTDQQMPGVGISIGVTRLYFVLQEIGFFEKDKMEDEEKYLVIPLGDTLKGAIEVYQSLQKQGIKSEIYLNQDTMKKQLRYAAAKGIEWVVIIGEEEMAKGELAIKNMITGVQENVNREKWLRDVIK